MGCIGCNRLVPQRHGLCERCWRTIEPVGERRLDGGLLVRSGMLHEGLARRLVHLLKYRGVLRAAAPLAFRMAAVVPEGTRHLVPVPRARIRVLRYGVDPGLELARATAGLTGISVVRRLAPPLWSARHAGKARSARPAPAFTRRSAFGLGVSVEERAVLVDDVVTTGATLDAAKRALGPGPTAGVTATGAV